MSLNTQENPFEVEELKEEEIETKLVAETRNDEFRIEEFDLMPVGTILKGGCIRDIPRKEISQVEDQCLLPLFLRGPLGLSTLPSPTPLEDMEEGEIPLSQEEEEKIIMPPPPTIEEDILVENKHEETREEE